MKSFLKYGIVLLLCLGVSGCELLCQAGTGTCGMTKEQRQRIRNPKAYGQFWTKPGMTKESWHQDWLDCGGMSGGHYSGNVPPGSSDAVSTELWTGKRKKLDTCMQSKGYTFKYTD